MVAMHTKPIFHSWFCRSSFCRRRSIVMVRHFSQTMSATWDLCLSLMPSFCVVPTLDTPSRHDKPTSVNLEYAPDPKPSQFQGGRIDVTFRRSRRRSVSRPRAWIGFQAANEELQQPESLNCTNSVLIALSHLILQFCVHGEFCVRPVGCQISSGILNACIYNYSKHPSTACSRNSQN